METRANTLLVVDDELNNRDLLSRRLRRSGFEVATASDGQTALEMIARDRAGYDLVLLDHMMPGLTGLEVLRMLRATTSGEQLPVIMVTALTESEHIVEALNSGANDYVTKPLDYPVVLARIRSQLARKIAEKALRESEQRYALAALGTNDGLWDWDIRTGKVYYSARWKAMLGYEDHEIGDSIEEFLGRIPQEDRRSAEAMIREQWEKDSPEPCEREYRMMHKDGTYRWVLCRGLAVRDPLNKEVVRMAGAATDVTERKVYDALTGLPNRLLFEDRLNRLLRLYGEDHSRYFALLFLDLDRFKLINDSLGHLAGDQLLTSVAERLRQSVRSGPLQTIARLGGDEFALLVDGLHCAKDATRIADRILQSLRSPFLVDQKPVFCSASIGISLAAPDYQCASDMVRDADIAMYSAKTAGKGRWAVFDGDMRNRVVARVELEGELQVALERNDFRVYYQPKVHLKTGRIAGFEALVRWHHPERGVIPPSDFIPIAEENGLIVPIGAWVLRKSCEQLRTWTRDHPAGGPVAVSVNLSPRQFRDPGLVSMVRSAIAESGADPERLDLEITEGVLFDDLDRALGVLHELKALGVGLKIDDFGTGYSGLSYLCRLPFDTLKIDRSFTVDLSREGSNRQMIRTILEMAKHLGMEVVAEGIEWRDQLDQLRILGCQFGQGYYFAKPLPAEEAETLLETCVHPMDDLDAAPPGELFGFQI